MVKLLLKLAIAALVANAAWRLGSAYLQFYRFQDAATQTAQFAGDRPIADMKARMLAVARQYDVPLDDAAVVVSKNQLNHTIIDGTYETPVDLFPGYTRQWPFSFHVDVFSIPGAVPPVR
jgi:hypothetical protein